MNKLNSAIGNLTALLDNQSNTIIELEINLIDPDPAQPRQTYDEESLQELKDSIKDEGVLQPIAVKASGGGRYQIIFGERRFRACKALKLKTVPAIIRDANDKETLVLQLIENSIREDVPPLEEAAALQKLVGIFGTAKNVAAKISKSEAYISQRIKLLSLPPEAVELMEEGITNDIDAITNVAKIAKKDPAAAQRLVSKAKKEGKISRSDVRNAVAETKGKKGKVEAKPAKPKNDDVKAIQLKDDEGLTIIVSINSQSKDAVRFRKLAQGSTASLAMDYLHKDDKKCWVKFGRNQFEAFNCADIKINQLRKRKQI